MPEQVELNDLPNPQLAEALQALSALPNGPLVNATNINHSRVWDGTTDNYKLVCTYPDGTESQFFLKIPPSRKAYLATSDIQIEKEGDVLNYLATMSGEGRPFGSLPKVIATAEYTYLLQDRPTAFHCLLMEWIDGEMVTQAADLAAAEGLVGHLRQVAEIYDSAAGVGVTNTDIKSDNILRLTANPNVLVPIDWAGSGIDKELGGQSLRQFPILQRATSDAALLWLNQDEIYVSGMPEPRALMLRSFTQTMINLLFGMNVQSLKTVQTLTQILKGKPADENYSDKVLDHLADRFGLEKGTVRELFVNSPLQLPSFIPEEYSKESDGAMSCSGILAEFERAIGLLKKETSENH